MASSAIKILCVDDEADIRQDIAEELRDAGYEVVEAVDGLDGFETVLREEPDLVVSDLTMPRLDGHGLLRKLRDECPEMAELPIIFLSALSDREHILEGKRLGADDYLTKPIDYDLLLVTVEARVNQIQRMKAHKEAQMVKLYQSLSGRAAEEPAAEQGRKTNAKNERREPARAAKSAQQAGPAAPERQPTDVKPAQARKPGGLQKSTDNPGSRDSDQLDVLARNAGGRVVAGRFQMLALEAVKDSLGGDWPRHAERIKAIASDIITRRLASDDVFEVTKDHEFLVCFSSLGEKEAAFKAQSIAREIQACILGSDSLDPIVTESFSVGSDVHEVDLSESEAADSDTVVDLIAARLEQAVERARESEKEVMDRIVSDCGVVPLRIQTAKGDAAPVSLAEFDEVTRSQIASLQSARPMSGSLTADLDLLKLGRALELICDNALGAQPVLLVSVHFSTIESQSLLERYLKICGGLPESARNRLALNVIGVPEGYPLARTQSLIHALRRNCRLVTLELAGLSLGNIEPDALQVSIVAYNYRALLVRLEKNSNAFTKLITSLKKQRVRSLVYDLPKEADAELLFRQGVSFIAQK